MSHKMVEQLMPILVILLTTSYASFQEELLEILKTQFQEDNQNLIETLKKIPGYNSASNLLHPGFEHLTDKNGTAFMDDLISHLTKDEKKAIIRLYKDDSESISSDFLKQLPSVWQSLTLEKTYSLNRTDDWVEAISSQPPDLSLLYSLGKTMKTVGAGADDQVAVSGLVPPPFLHHFKFLGSHLHAQLIKFLTMDNIKTIPKNEYPFAVDILKDVWFQVQPGKQEAWYHLFKDSTENYLNGNIKDIEKYGYLLGGAPLEDIELLSELAPFDNGSSWWIKLIQETQMNPLRMQAIWDSLNEDDKKTSFSDLAGFLHVVQIQKYYEDHDWRAVSARDFIERKDTPLENILMFSKLDPSPVLVSVLSIPELAKFVNTTDWDVESVYSSLTTYGQAMVLYKQWTEENVGHTPLEIPAQLLHVLPSQHIQNHLVLRKHDFIQQSNKMLQSQMSALHKGLRSQLWEIDTMEMILDSHPQCFEAASPAEFRKNLHLVLKALPEVEVTKYDGVLEVARKLRNLPRELQTAWLEAAFQRQHTRGNQYWNTSKLLQVTDDNRAAVALLGLNCQQIERIRPSDTMQVLTAYHYLMDIHSMETDSPGHIPRHARKCWANKIRTYLKIKSILAEVDVSREVDLLSLLSSAEVKTVGGEILLGWGADVLMSISGEKVRNEVVEAVAALPPCHLINNVINFPEVKLLANQNVPHSMHLSQLTRMANFFPYIHGFEKKVTKSDFKLFVQSLSEHERSICTNKQMRESIRELIVGSFGLPQNLSALDLAQLGDLLIVLDEDDMSRVNPHSLVLANSQLVASASFSRPLPQFLKEIKLVPYYEACRRWLPRNESKEFEAALRRLSDFYTLGSYLSLETINNIRGRRKREISDNSLWTNTINLLTEWYTNDKLSWSEQQMCNQIILAGQLTLESRAANSFDIEFFEATKEITTGLIGTQKQDQYLIKLNKLELKEIVTQIKYKIVHQVIKLLNWKTSDVNVSRNSFNSAMALSTPIVEDTYNFYLEKYLPCPTASSLKPDGRSAVPDSEARGQIPNLNYKQLHAQVLQLLIQGQKDGIYSEQQKLTADEIRSAGLSALAREALKIFNMLDENGDASFKDVLKIIKQKKKNKSFTKQHHEEISQITNQILLKILQEMIKYLNLSEEDLEVDEYEFQHIRSADSSLVEESYNFYRKKSLTSSVAPEKTAALETTTNKYVMLAQTSLQVRDMSADTTAQVEATTNNIETTEAAEITPSFYPTNELNFYELFRNVSLLLSRRQLDGNLSNSHKQRLTTIVKDGKSAMARETFKILAMPDHNNAVTMKDVRSIIEKKKENGSLTEEKEEEIKEITREILLKMVQEIIRALSLTEDDLDLTADEFNYIVQLDTSNVEDSYDHYVQPGETSAAFEYKPETTEADGNDELLEVGSDDLLDDGNDDPLKDARVIKCNVLRIAGKAITEFRESILKKMEADQVEACLETIGSFKFDQTTAHSLWLEVKRVVFPSGGLTGTEMILLGSLLPTIAKFDLSMLDLTSSNLEGISVLGRHLHDGCYSPECDFSSVPANVIQEYIAINHVDKFSAVELESFGQLLCGLTARDWDEKVTDAVFAEVHFIFNRIHCNLSSTEARAAVERKVLAVNQPPQYWTPSDVAHLGWLVGNLSPQNVIKMKPSSISGVASVAARMWTQNHWNSLTAEHIKRIGPHVMSLINESSLPKVGDVIYFGKEKRKALRSAASEGTELMQWMDRLLTKMEDLDSSSP